MRSSKILNPKESKKRGGKKKETKSRWNTLKTAGKMAEFKTNIKIITSNVNGLNMPIKR